jgi:hypothetical protein
MRCQTWWKKKCPKKWKKTFRRGQAHFPDNRLLRRGRYRNIEDKLEVEMRQQTQRTNDHGEKKDEKNLALRVRLPPQDLCRSREAKEDPETLVQIQKETVQHEDNRLRNLDLERRL